MDSKIPANLRPVIDEQAGVASRQQLLDAGVFRTTVDYRVKSGRWQQVYPGAYATFSGVPPWQARLWAAVLYAGPDALLSDETAAEILQITKDRDPDIHLVIPAHRRVRPQEGLVVRRSTVSYQRWRPARGVPPHTFYAETIIDLVAGSGTLDEAVAWVSRGIAQNQVNEHELKTAAAARRRFRWGAQLGEIVGRVASGSHFPLEFRYGRDVERAHGLPPATRQAKFTNPDGTKGFRDRYYPDYNLIVELDGKKYHPAEQQERDRARDNEAAVAAGATLRYNWADISRASCETAAQVYRALRERGYQGKLKPCSATCRAVVAAEAPALRVRADRYRADR